MCVCMYPDIQRVMYSRYTCAWTNIANTTTCTEICTIHNHGQVHQTRAPQHDSKAVSGVVACDQVLDRNPNHGVENI